MVARGGPRGAALLRRFTRKDSRLAHTPHRFALPLLAAALLALGGCAVNPVSGRRQLSLVSASQELQIGREGYGAVVGEYGAYDPQGVQTYVDSVGQRLARVSHLPDLAWHFTVLDDPTVNAFAMPGGYIYVTRGILAHLNSEAQLAGVLGHEIGHVTARHTAEQITKQQLAGLGLGIASLVSEGFRRYGSQAETALNLLFLKYSRDNESQADELGVAYATRAGYDPREIPATYAMLKRVSERAGQRIPSFLATHPDPGDREQRTTALAAQAATGKTGLQIRGRAYVQRLEGLVFGRDPRQGYFEGERYYHPALGFEIGFPRGWRTQDSHAAVAAADPQGAAAMELSLADAGDRSPEGYVQSLLRAGRLQGAQGTAEAIGGLPGWAGRVSQTDRSGNPVTLVAFFIRKAPDQMFQIFGRSGNPGDANEGRVLASARTFRPLADPARRDAAPDRVRVVASPAAGTFQGVLGRLGPQAAEPAETAILNNLAVDEGVQAGQLLKIVRPGRLR